MSPDGDVYHHLATGKYILENLKFPTTDEWTFTAHGLPWIAHSWGGALLMELSFRAMGPLGLSILFALAAVLTMFLMYKLLQMFSVTLGTSIVVLTFAAPILALRWPTRPESFQFLFFAGLLLVERYRLLKPKTALLFPIIILLWANIYGASVMFGICLVLFFYGSHIVTSHVRFDKRSFFFGTIVIASIISGFLNPYGIGTIGYPILLHGIAPYQGEWAGIVELIKIAPIEILITVQYHILLYILYAVAFLLCLAKSWRTLVRHKNELFLSFTIFLPFVAFRFLPHAVMLTLPAIAIALSGNQKWIRKVTALVAVATIALSLWLQLPVVNTMNNPFPSDIIAFIEKNNISGKIFANQRLGSFLEYYLAPESTVYVDTRDDLYLSTGTIQEYFTVFSQEKSVVPLLKKHDVDIVVADVLSEGSSYRPLFYSQFWVPVFLSDRFIVFIKKSSADQKNLVTLSAIDPFSPSGAKTSQDLQATAQYKTVVQSPKDNPSSAVWLIKSLTQLHEYAKANDILDALPQSRGPQRIFETIDRALLGARLSVLQSRCTLAQQLMTKAIDETKFKRIFTPFTPIAIQTRDLEVLYATYCGNK